MTESQKDVAEYTERDVKVALLFFKASYGYGTAEYKRNLNSIIHAARESSALREKLEIETASNGISRRQFTAMQKENDALRERVKQLEKAMEPPVPLAADGNGLYNELCQEYKALEIENTRLKAEIAAKHDKACWCEKCMGGIPK